jgi:ABC-2 type transport system permease protein
MMSLWEAAWVIARRDFVATVYSRTFILFLLAPLIVIVFAIFVSQISARREARALQPVVAVVADSATARRIVEARQHLADGTSEQAFPILRVVAPAEHVDVQTRQLLADTNGNYSAVLSGTLDHPVLTGPRRADDFVVGRLQLVVDQARQAAALAGTPGAGASVALDRVVTAAAAGNLQMLRRQFARAGQSLIFAVTILLATMLLSTLVEEKSNKVIEVLAAAVPLDSIFLGKLFAMLAISTVGLLLWGAIGGTAYLFSQVVSDWVSLPDVSPAVGWPAFVLLIVVYYATNFLLLGSLFLGIGGQANSIREIQTISMPVTMLQLLVFLLAVNATGADSGWLGWAAWLVPFSSPLAMVGYAAMSDTLWPHLVVLVWQLLWVVVIVRLSSRLFQRTVMKSAAPGRFFDLKAWRAGLGGRSAAP